MSRTLVPVVEAKQLSRKQKTAERHQRLRKKVGAPCSLSARIAVAADAAWAHTHSRPICAPVQLSGTADRPRLAVFRSNEHIYAQVRAMQAGVAHAAASSGGVLHRTGAAVQGHAQLCRGTMDCR